MTPPKAEVLAARHTDEPLVVFEGEQYCFHDTTRVSIQHEEDGEEGRVFITVAEVWPAGDKVDIADAHRLVDCFNACAGVADPEAEIARLRRDKAELVGALILSLEDNKRLLKRLAGSEFGEGRKEEVFQNWVRTSTSLPIIEAAITNARKES